MLHLEEAHCFTSKMACGWTPDLMRMLESMADEKQRLAVQAAQELSATAQQVDAAKRRSHEAAQSTAKPNGYDWTSVYDKWDAWEDPEELAQREQEAREKQQRAAKAAATAGCNHDHSAEQKLMDMTFRQKVRACDEFRTFGNRFFAQGQYQRAAYNYHKALVYFEYMFPETEAEDQAMEALRLKTLLNFSACRLKTGHIDDVIHHADLALAIDENNAKALYRRAQGYRIKDEFTAAVADINAASKHQHGGAVDPVLVAEKQLLQAKMLAYKYKSRQVSSAMFGGKTHATQEPRKLSEGRVGGGVKDVPLQLRSVSKDAKDWNLDDSWRPCTEGLQELEALLL